MDDTLTSLLAAAEAASLRSIEADRVEREARGRACSARNDLTKAEKVLADFLVNVHPRLAEEIGQRVRIGR